VVNEAPVSLLDKKALFLHHKIFNMPNNYRIEKDTQISDNYVRYFLYVDDRFMTGSDTLEDIERIAHLVWLNDGSLHVKETIKEYTK
jgi:hypothetical protein